MNPLKARTSSLSKGAYILRIRLRQPAHIQVGQQGRMPFSPGDYLYIGSAIRNLDGRINRHIRLAICKKGGGRWHVDTLLRHRAANITATAKFPKLHECELSQLVARLKGIRVPVAGFGATDCKNACAAHLYDASSVSSDDMSQLL
jgi:Uri superfamily endonuclease